MSSGIEAPKSTPTDRDNRKKKKGIFGGLFGKHQGKQKRAGSRKPGKSPGRRLKLEGSGDGSI
jgi:hypothetical protein